MLRLAIIDDEEETRQIMVNFIDWDTYGITVVGEARMVSPPMILSTLCARILF